MSVSGGKNELQEGLEVIESTNLNYFNREMTAEFYALKGMLLAQIGRSEEANKAFSASVQVFTNRKPALLVAADINQSHCRKELVMDNLINESVRLYLKDIGVPRRVGDDLKEDVSKHQGLLDLEAAMLDSYLARSIVNLLLGAEIAEKGMECQLQ